jgi:uncharacterized membrane protein
MKFGLVYFISLFLLVLVTGVFWGTWFTLTRSIDQFSAAEFIHIGKVIISNVAIPMRIIMPSCILLMALSLWFYPQKNSGVFYLKIAGLVLIVTALLITLIVLVPIDNKIKTWTVETVPGDWESMRANWQKFHTIRTFCSLAAFACFSAFSFNKKTE